MNKSPIFASFSFFPSPFAMAATKRARKKEEGTKNTHQSRRVTMEEKEGGGGEGRRPLDAFRRRRLPLI